ncbi:MAG: FtsX-like permease family protein [Methanobacteriota archaeon]|nr:MAG: FtsX-like permease family protein [Euryarchaeota archaeon]
MDFTLAIVVFVVGLFVFVLALALRNRVLFRISARNLLRKKTNTVIVVAGLLIGTAIVTSSYVMGDTLAYIFEESIYDELYTVDEIIGARSGDAGTFEYYPYEYYTNLSVARDAGQLPSVDGLCPIIIESVPVKNNDTMLSEATVNIIGVDPQNYTQFGDFVEFGGGQVDEGTILSQPNAAIINRRLAWKIDAQEGHLLAVYVDNPFIPTAELNITTIVSNDGKANFFNGDNVFISLSTAQQLFGEPGSINLMLVSNVGDMESGVEKTDSAVAEIENAIGTELESLGLIIEPIKAEELEFVEITGELITEVFAIMGTFSIIAGVILVVNIFVMLAEERKPEMGISRALGMKRKHLIQTYLFEGSAYALMASFVGVFVGLLIAYVMIAAFAYVFGAAAFEISFHFEIESLILGFCIGVLITFFTVAIASWVVSRLNIVRAIRAIPEPALTEPTKRFMVGGILLVLLGVIIFRYGMVMMSGAFFMTGPCIILLGAAMLATRWIRPRISYSVASIAILFWILAPIEWMEGLEIGMEMFLLSGLFLVLAAIILLMVNSTSLLKALTRIIGGSRRTLPVMRVALSYPMKRKFRTGMTLSMFALIIFTVTVIAMISSFQKNSVETAYVQQAGGYDIIAFSFPVPNITDGISSNPDLNNRFDEVSSLSFTSVEVYHQGESQDTSQQTRILGADDSFFEDCDFTFYSVMSGYESPDEVWDAVRTNSSLVVVDGSVVTTAYGPAMMFVGFQAEVGDTVVVQKDGLIYNKTIIGILDEVFFFQGLITSREFAINEFGFQFPTTFFFTASDSNIENVRELAKNLEKGFSTSGMQTIVIRDLITDILEIMSSIMGLFQVYLGLGLIVGIAGLGIITVRSVVERRQEIGVMRAIGYKRKMIRRTFIMEITFISLLGIFVGVILGIALSYYMYQDFFAGSASLPNFFTLIPFWNIFLIATVAFIATLLATMSSAFRASRIVPAEALRLKE